MNTFDHIAIRLSNIVRKLEAKERQAPLKISIMGQTGVGKTSLVNALFAANLAVDPVRPSTRDFDKPYIFTSSSGQQLWFYDLPGIGESQETEVEYLEKYRQKLVESDIVLWAIHGDSRSFVYDQDALQKIFELIEDERLKILLISKITFLLTKVDLLSANTPWYLAMIGKQAIFLPPDDTEKLLEQKESFLQETFIIPYSDSLVSQTYHDGSFDIDDPHISYDKNLVHHRGFLNREGLTVLKERFPGHEEVFDRLYDNYRVISCSSRYRFNLGLLMRVIINKIGSDAVTRFSNFFKSDTQLDLMPLSTAKGLRNFIIFDQAQKRIVFDLADTEIGEDHELQ